MAEPTETITSTVAAPDVEPVEVGVCSGCDQPIYSGDGITVDKEHGRWHPECRSANLRQAGAPSRSKRATVSA